MAMRTLSLASIIAESQQGEQAARRAAPRVAELGGVGLPDPYGSHYAEDVAAEEAKRKQRDTGNNAIQEDQKRLDKEAEEKKKLAEEEARKVTMSAADSLQTIQQLDYTQTFLKIFGLA